jgi:hypothetical protein
VTTSDENAERDRRQMLEDVEGFLRPEQVHQFLRVTIRDIVASGSEEIHFPLRELHGTSVRLLPTAEYGMQREIGVKRNKAAELLAIAGEREGC